MDWLAQLEYGKLLLLALILTRISGVVMTAPVFGAQDVPMQIRALLAFALSLLILPTQWNATIPWPGTTLNFLVYVGSELLIGLSLGLGLQILFTGIQLTGQILAQAGGEAMAEIYDPSIDQEISVHSRLMFLLTLVLFLTMGGHRVVMAGLLDTFVTLPLGHCAFPHTIPETLVALLSQSFSLAVRAAAPTMTALLLATVSLGLIGRTVPQLNVMGLGFGVNALVLPAVLCLSLGAAALLFQDQVEPALTSLLEALHAPARTVWLGS
jgi:flagellar biosynthesis protein FliR